MRDCPLAGIGSGTKIHCYSIVIEEILSDTLTYYFGSISLTNICMENLYNNIIGISSTGLFTVETISFWRTTPSTKETN